MPSKTKLTNSSDETDLSSIFARDVIFQIPFFQRPYKWKIDKLRQFYSDLLTLVDETSDFHFLGAIIVHGRRNNPSDPDIFDVIDGQQRLTTLYIFICGLVKHLIDIGDFDNAAGLLLKYLAINRSISGTSNLKLHPCAEDRAQLNSVVSELVSDKEFNSHLGGFKLTKLLYPANTKNTGRIWSNYKAILRFLKDEQREGGPERIQDILNCLLNKISVVQIVVNDPASGPKIFDSLNSKQEPMTIGDLVRNGIFSKVADQEPDEIERIDREYWQPFYTAFEVDGKNLFDGYFFPFGLIQNQNLSKSEIFSALKQSWSSLSDPEEIISSLVKYQDAFIDLTCGTSRLGLLDDQTGRSRRLFEMGSPNSTLPFFMQLFCAARDGSVSSFDLLGIVDVIESFLVRRAICGIEPTGLHAVFKRLWSDCAGEMCANRVRAEISKHKTVTWPSEDDLRVAVRERPQYGSSVTAYFLKEYDIFLKGDNPAKPSQIEHILPQEPTGKWLEDFSSDEIEKYMHVFANLLPLSESMNKSLGNGQFEVKVERYRLESMYVSTRRFAHEFATWDGNQLRKRSDMLADWAVSRWPS